MDVGIVGGGKERGIACRVYERAPESKSSGLASRCFRMPCGSLSESYKRVAGFALADVVG